LVTFPPERVMAALAPLTEPAPSIEPTYPQPPPKTLEPSTPKARALRLLGLGN